MNQQLDEEQKLRRYFLGELNLEEQVLIEQRLFLDSEYEELAQSLEDELIHDYVQQDLTEAERERFEKHFLVNPERQEELGIAVALKRFLNSQPARDAPTTPVSLLNSEISKANSYWSYLFQGRRHGLSLAVLLIALCTITWVYLQIKRRSTLQTQNPKQIEQPTPPISPEQEVRIPPSPEPSPGYSPTQNPHAVRQDPKQRRPVHPRQPAPTGIATFVVLPSSGVRGNKQKRTVPLSDDIGTVVLKLPLVTEDHYDKYRATLQSRGNTIRTWPDLKPELDDEVGKMVQVNIMASLLQPQSYNIKLAGVVADGSPPPAVTYIFHIERK